MNLKSDSSKSVVLWRVITPYGPRMSEKRQKTKTEIATKDRNVHTPQMVDLSTFKYTVSQVQISETDKHSSKSVVLRRVITPYGPRMSEKRQKTKTEIATKDRNVHTPQMVDLSTFKYTVSQVQISETDKQNTYLLLHHFHLLVTKHKIDYVGYGGTILGAVRHGDLIPWDDDADFVMMKRNTATLFRAIASQSLLKLCYMNDDFYKVTFYDNNLAKDSNKYCAWPNLDIFFAHDMGHKIKVYFQGAYIYHKSSFFPSVIVPFGPVHLRFPRCFRQLAIQAYSLDVCCTGSWDHRLEDWAPRPACIHCNQLRDYVPFSNFRRLNSSSAKMVLSMDKKVIREEIVKMPVCNKVSIQFIEPESYKPVVEFS